MHHLVEHRAFTPVLEPRDDVDNPVNVKQLHFFQLSDEKIKQGKRAWGEGNKYGRRSPRQKY